MKFAPLRGIAQVRLRPPDAMPRNGNRSEGSVGNPSIGNSKRCSDEPGHACSTRQALA